MVSASVRQNAGAHGCWEHFSRGCSIPCTCVRPVHNCSCTYRSAAQHRWSHNMAAPRLLDAWWMGMHTKLIWLYSSVRASFALVKRCLEYGLLVSPVSCLDDASPSMKALVFGGAACIDVVNKRIGTFICVFHIARLPAPRRRVFSPSSSRRGCERSLQWRLLLSVRIDCVSKRAQHALHADL